MQSKDGRRGSVRTSPKFFHVPKIPLLNLAVVQKKKYHEQITGEHIESLRYIQMFDSIKTGLNFF